MTGRVGWGVLAALALAGCGDGREPAVTRGWVRLAANPNAPAAAYFTLTAGREPETLLTVSTVAARRAELHESMAMGPEGNGMITMAPLAGVPVPAGGEVAFAPGGRHVMLFDVNGGVKPGGVVAMAFTFADGKRLGMPLKVVGPGDPAPY